MIDLKDKKIYIFLGIAIILALILVYPKFFATKKVNLYFSDQQAQYLVPETRRIKIDNFYYNLLNELIIGPQSRELGVTIPPQTKVLKVNVEDKVAEVNFSEELETKHWGGSTGEILTVYSIVNTLTKLEEIDKVQILISGNKIETLAGHLELDHFLGFNKNLIDSK